MSLDVSYKGSRIAQLTQDGSLTLKTAGTYLEGDVGLSLSGMGGGGDNGWQRPSDWPDLDSIDLTGFEGEYLTYDLRKTPGYGWIGVDLKIDGGTAVFERGHLADNAFVVDETFDYDSPYVNTEYSKYYGIFFQTPS